MEERGKLRNKGGYSKSENYLVAPIKNDIKNNLYYPKNILNYGNASQVGKIHPTQKSVELCEYLIKTYTKESEVVLDNCFGSGTTGVACKRTGRSFIGIEMDDRYFELGSERIEKEEWVSGLGG
jgi:site-specific DNA-methyltransferase (adenine-specific)